MNQTPKAPRRRWNIKPWPWPGDGREDKAKRVAVSYRELIFEISQGRCDDSAGELHRLDRYWAEFGVYWQTPREPVDSGEWLTAAEVAHYAHVTPADIYRWARRGHIRQRAGADGSPEYLLGSVRTYQDQQRQRRISADL